MKKAKKSFKQVFGWLLCIVMLLSVLPPSAIAKAEDKMEVLITVDNAGVYSKADARTDKYIVDRVPVNSVLNLANYGTVLNDYLEGFYEVFYTVNGKTETCYVLCTQAMPFYEGVKQPKNSTIAYVSSLKDGETARVYFAKGESTFAYTGVDVDPRLSNGAMIFVKDNTDDGWTEFYFGDTVTQFVETKYLNFDKAESTWVPTPTPSPTPKPSPTPRPEGIIVPKGTVTTKDAPIYETTDIMDKKLITLPVNTVVELVSTKVIPDAYNITSLYEVIYQVDGKTITGYMETIDVNVYENDIKQPKGTTKECIQGLANHTEIKVKYNGNVIGWLMNNADVYVYQKTAKKAIINFNGVKAEIDSKYVVTPTATPTPTPTLSQVKKAKAGEYDVVAEGTVVYSSTKLLTNPSAREKAVEATLKAGTVLDIVSLEKVSSIDANSEDMQYYKIVYKGKNGLGYYYVLSDEIAIRNKGQIIPAYLVDGTVSGLGKNKITDVRSSTETYNSNNIIAQVANGTKLKIDPVESTSAWTKIYINNQFAYIRTKYVTRNYTSAKDILTADKTELAKKYPNINIIAQAYLVGTDSVVQEKNTIEIKPIQLNTSIQNDIIRKADVPKDSYLAYEASTLSVVYYDYDTVIFWSNGYQLEKDDLDRVDSKADALKEVHTAGFYEVPRELVLLDLGDAEVASAGEKVKIVAEGMATTNVGLHTAPEEPWDSYAYVVPQNSRIDLVSTEKIPATDGSGTTYYKIAITHGSTTGYLNKENVSYYYVNSDFINVYKNDFSTPMIARAGVITTLTEDEYIAVYADQSENSEVLGYLTRGANVDIRSKSSGWSKIVFNSDSGYVKTINIVDPQLDKTGIPDPKAGVIDIYFTQCNLQLSQVYPELEVLYKVKLVGTDGKVTAGNYHTVNTVDPYTVIQGQRIAAKYFPDWNIENIKTLNRRYLAATSFQDFTFTSGAYLELEGQMLDVVAYDKNNVIVWSPGYRGFTYDTFAVDCRQYAIQYNHPAGFYSIPRRLVEFYSAD